METDKMSDHFMISYNSLVERTLTTDCFSLSGLSLDQRGIPLASASARNGESSLSGENSIAFFKNCEMYSFGSNFILESNIAINSLYFSSLNLDFSFISSRCSSSSDIIPSGEYKINLEFKSKSLATEFLTIAENTMLVSITSSIYTMFLYTFSHMLFLIFLPRTSASSSVNRLSAAMASNISSSAAVFRIASLAMFDQFIEACLRIMTSRSSGICTITSGMFDNMNFRDIIITEILLEPEESTYSGIYREEVEVIGDGARKCPNCGREVEANEKFCMDCGAKL